VREKKSNVEIMAKEYSGQKVAMLFTSPRHWQGKPQPYETEWHSYNWKDYIDQM
jgi:hypothetical protein